MFPVNVPLGLECILVYKISKIIRAVKETLTKRYMEDSLTRHVESELTRAVPFCSLGDSRRARRTRNRVRKLLAARVSGEIHAAGDFSAIIPERATGRVLLKSIVFKGQVRFAWVL